MKRLLFLSTLFFCGVLNAALPIAVNGQPLPSLAPMLKKVMPSVVSVTIKSNHPESDGVSINPVWQRFFNAPDMENNQLTQSLGSGVIVDAELGYILTNHHVIDGAVEITVTLNDGRELYAETVGKDFATDVAVIKIKPGDLKQIHLADSSQLEVGDFVVAIGNPFGLGQTATSGIVSALGRSGLGIESYEDFIQTDAAINLGNSGGALVNLSGELVGINTAILGNSENNGNIGIGFSIPINMVQQIMHQLIEFGEVKRGRLGVQVEDLSPQLAKALKVSYQQKGVVITQIEIGSAADLAGLKIADVIIIANKKNIRSTHDMKNLVGLLSLKQSVNMQILRRGELISRTVEVQEATQTSLLGEQLHQRLHGALIVESNKLDLQQGELHQILIKSVKNGSQAWLVGFREGDEILVVNKNRVDRLDVLRSAFTSQIKPTFLVIKRDDRMIQVLLE